MNLRVLLLVVGAFVGGALCARGQVVYTWTGVNDSFYADSPENWLGNVVPLDDLANTQIVFGAAQNTHLIYGDIDINKVTFSGITKSFWLMGDDATIYIGNGGIVYSPGSSITSRISGGVMLEANQTWNIQSGSLVIEDDISSSGTFGFTKTGAGNLTLQGYGSDFTGDVTLSGGTLTIGVAYGGSPLGYGKLIFNGGTLIASSPLGYSGSYVEFVNNVVSNGLITTINHVPLSFSTDDSSTLTLNANTTVDTSGQPLFVESDIVESGGSRKLTLNGTGQLILSGTNTYTGGTDVINGNLIFTTLGALPDAPATNALTTSVNGYIGLADSGTYNFQTSFVDLFNKAATFGTIGFDTDPSYGTIDFTSNIVLTGFAASAKLGSATSAILSGTITPQGTDYRFGGGGGFLDVTSQLSGARNVVVDSTAAYPLTLRLSAFNNSFTGTISVTNSAVIFTDVSLPVGGRTITIGTGGYAGTESGHSGSMAPDTSDIAYFLNHIALSSVGVIGFDSNYSYAGDVVSRDINLSAFTGPLYLGTSNIGATDDGIYGGIILSGIITTTNGGADPYRFAGYKGGLLEVDSTLSGAQGVIIGDPNSPATFGDLITGAISTVYLTGNNSALTGNIILYGGTLAIGQSNGVQGTDPTNALGSGTLIVQPMSFPAAWTALGQTPQPVVVANDVTLVPNAVTLNTGLHIGEYSYGLTFTGKISGTGGLYLEEDSNLTLSNDTNDFTGGIYVGNNAYLYLNANHAAGPGAISFGSTNGTVHFATLAPVVNGLISTSVYDYSYISADIANVVLTISQSFDSQFQGTFASSDISNSMRIVKTGSGTLRLDDGGMIYTHGTVEPTLPGTPEVSLQVNQGTVVLGQSFYLNGSTPTVWVHGGTLTLDNTSIDNKVVVDNGGRMQGSGTVYNFVTFPSGTVISPGVAGPTQIGFLEFNDLTLMGGATLEWNLRNPNGTAGADWDVVSITNYSPTLHIDASVTPATPFTIKLISLNANGTPGTAVGFLNQGYTWTVFDATNSNIVFGGGSFNAAAFHLDTSAFSADIGPGNFSFSQTGNLLQINFVPVPEPSTYALLGIGLSAMALGFVRRRRA